MPVPGDTPGEKRTDLVPIFAAFCLFLSTVEYVIPKPLPFMRLGISNLPLLLGISLFSPAEYLLLVLAKIVGMSLVSGTLFSYVFVFSFAGSAVSGLVMYFLKKAFRGHIGYIGVSVLGAAASNAMQIGLASVFVFGRSALLIAPPFLASGAVTGLALGVFAERFAEKSAWFRKALEGSRT
jgi:heptaprenyl diphosphate synthase